MENFRTLIISAEHVELARKIASTLSSAGENMWVTPLSFLETTKVSYYISTGTISAEFAFLVPYQTGAQENEAWVKVSSNPGNVKAIVELCASADLQVTAEQVQAIFDTSDITDQDPFTAIGRLNLYMFQEEV